MKRKKDQILVPFTPALRRRYGAEQSREILALARSRRDQLCRENEGQPPAVRVHTEGKIFPTMALYEAMQQTGIPREEARLFLYDALEDLAQQSARPMRLLFKIPGLYRLMPRAYRAVTRKSFGTDAGFRFHFYDVGSHRVKFDMLQCPYWDTCCRYGCPELVAGFCHTDDITSGTIHPKLHWNRTQTLGCGGDRCDFDLFYP